MKLINYNSLFNKYFEETPVYEKNKIVVRIYVGFFFNDKKLIIV